MFCLPRFPAVVVILLLALLYPVLPGSADAVGQQLTPNTQPPATLQPNGSPALTDGVPGNQNCVGGGGFQVCAMVTNSTPAQYTDVTVWSWCGGSVCSIITGPRTMVATWYFQSGVQTCTATTDNLGWAACTLNIGAAALGYRVNIDVNYGGVHVTTWFTPEVDCSTVTEVPPSECEALEALYNSAQGAGWSNHGGWVITDTPCSWYGVTCSAQHVASLDLSANQLSGTVPPDLGKLTDMQTLRLGNNQLTGGIPPDLRYAYRLQLLDLSNNLFSGSIPRELGNLHFLTSLHLNGNQFAGSIPAELGNLAGLAQLDISSNQLRGCLPQSLTNLHALQTFHFDTGLLAIPDNAAFAAWLAGIPDRSPGGTTCKNCYLPAVEP